MNDKRLFLLTVLLFFLMGTEARAGGKSVYNFLNLSYSSRVSALGGNLVSLKDADPTCIAQNPSYISPDHHTSLALNVTDYFSNVAYLSACYSHTFKKAGSFLFEARYIGYGKFKGTDVIGNETGDFSAGDYALTVGWGRKLHEYFYLGANLKTIFCNYENFNSFGMAVDVAGSFYHAPKNISLSLLFKNIGSEIKPFTPGNYESMPFDIQLAFSQKFKYLPVRYHISLHSLYRWNMAYIGDKDPFLEIDAQTGEAKYPSSVSRFFDNFFRHIVFGLEIEPVKYLSLQVAYNHHRHQEMKIPQKGSMAGFSYGFTVNIHSIRIGFSRAHYAVGAVPNYFTFSANIEELSKLSKENKKKKLERVKL